jgi:hypothetical protein
LVVFINAHESPFFLIDKRADGTQNLGYRMGLGLGSRIASPRLPGTL